MAVRGIAPHHRVGAELHERARLKATRMGFSMSSVAARGLSLYTQGELTVVARRPAQALPEALRANLRRFHDSNDSLLDPAIKALRAAKWPVAAIAQALEVSRQAIHLRLRKPTLETVPKLPFAIPVYTSSNPSKFDWAFWIEGDDYSNAVQVAEAKGHSMTDVMSAVLEEFVSAKADVLRADMRATSPLLAKANK